MRAVGSDSVKHARVRIVAATNRDLTQMVREGRFRADLYYRLTAFEINVPPLRDRREDIPRLVAHFARARARNGRLVGFSEAALARLVTYDWPGNVRELRNAADRLVLGVGRTPVVPDASEDGMPLKERVERYERTVIAETLARTGGSVHQAADILQVGRATLYDKIKRYGL